MRPTPLSADNPPAPAAPGKAAREPRDRRSELVLTIGWALVLIKCAVVWWICRHVPSVRENIGAGWVIVPTLLFASLCTWVYVRRD